MQKRSNFKSSSASKKSPYYEVDYCESKTSKKSSKDNWKKYGKSMLKSYANY